MHASELSHTIVKRGINSSPHPFNKIKEVTFKTLGREFRLVLTPRKHLLHSQFKAYEVDENGAEKLHHLDPEDSELYEGRVFGETESDASVQLENGVMTATVRTKEDTYHIEPAWRHMDDPERSRMITYRGSDVEEPETPASHLPPTSHCAYVREDGNATGPEWSKEDGPHVRAKRQTTEAYTFNMLKTRCPLLLVADYRFYKDMGGSSTKTTINYLISLIDRVDKIYRETVWADRAGDHGLSAMGFVIKKILVHNAHTPVTRGQEHYNMDTGSWDVRHLLEVFSREPSHEDFCLAHLFTDIRFDGGILGLAYVGSPRRNSVGGICTPEYFKNGFTLYLNSGLSSSRNHYGQRVITREADLVTAHEFGHNWGSEHDPDLPECSPSANKGGSYLMYTYSVSGYDLNNKRFSPCSLRSIRAVLVAKSSRCFTEPEESFCGNLRVEGDEECDAGLVGSEDEDACCDKNCQLRRKRGAVCSDKNSPCCSRCQYLQMGVKCRDASLHTCEMEAKCNGASAECPPSAPMGDDTECQEHGGRCRAGKCVAFCELQDQHSCMCDVEEDACNLCCRRSLNDTCTAQEPVRMLSGGTPCMHGFCTNTGVCEKTVQDVVERFWDIIEDININKVLRFLRDNIVGTVLVISIIIWVPASCIFSYVDAKRRRAEEQELEWQRRDQLIRPGERRVVYTRRRLAEREREYGATRR
ncbi:ADAM 17-like protease [Pollicipes pollicipes]|nr:ADAM 17-like protease [Pollicipes pollicipes]